MRGYIKPRAASLKGKLYFPPLHGALKRAHRRLWRKHDLADVAAAFHQGVGLGRLCQRIGAVDQGPYLSSLEQWPDLRLKVCGDRGLEGDRAGLRVEPVIVRRFTMTC